MFRDTYDTVSKDEEFFDSDLNMYGFYSIINTMFYISEKTFNVLGSLCDSLEEEEEEEIAIFLDEEEISVEEAEEEIAVEEEIAAVEEEIAIEEEEAGKQEEENLQSIVQTEIENEYFIVDKDL